jgi:homoserine O-acetyltransferase
MSLPEFLQVQISDQTRYLSVAEPFQLQNGEVIENVSIAYRTWGDLANADERAILICHALTGSADADTWWPGIIGENKAFDPAVDFIICANILGSCYGTTGPVSLKPGGDKRYLADFPRITIRDMVNLQRLLLDELGVDKLALVTGPSLGGMQALEWVVTYPEKVGSIVPIGVGAQHSAWCIGVSEAQRAAIEADPNWNNGYYSDEQTPDKGLAAARMMAVCTYRSWQSFDTRFGRDRSDDQIYQVQTYLRHQGKKINERFDANTYVTLTHAMHSHDLAAGRGALADVLQRIEQPALVVSVSTDALYPPHEQAGLAESLPNSEYEILDSEHGHDGFLIETTNLSDMIAAFRAATDAQTDQKIADFSAAS